MLIAYSWMASEKPGAFAEFGVMCGGSLDLLSRLHPERLIYGIDSFTGFPESGAMDIHKKGEFALSEEELLNIYECFKDRKVEVLQGFSPVVFDLIPSGQQYAFIHIDVDLYQSVRDALDYFYPRLIHGGIMIFDDYGFPSTPGAKMAIDEWAGNCTYRGEIIFNNGVKTGQYLVIK
jgi:hypothetical protein